MDVALSPVADDEFGATLDLELYQASDSARRAAGQAEARAAEMRQIELRRAG